MTASLKDACLVEVRKRGTKKSEDDQHSSCSGILINHKYGYVITHGTLLIHYFDKAEKLFQNISNVGSLSADYFKDIEVFVTVEHTRPVNKLLNQDVGRLTTQLNMSNSDGELCNSKTVKYTGKIQLMWKVKPLAQILQTIFSNSEDWKFTDDPTGKEDKDGLEEKKSSVDFLLPYFVLVKLDRWDRCPHDGDIYPQQNLRRGQTLFAVGTPFGSLSPSVFLNSVSRGIVCNIAGKESTLILTDARCIPGTEGGPLYVKPSSKNECQLVGMVVAPMCWKANEWIGLSIGCGLSDIVRSLRRLIRVNPLHNSREKYTLENLADTSGSNVLTAVPVVYVQCGASWGSGIIVDSSSGLVITCSHVVKGGSPVRVRVDRPAPVWYDAEIVYAVPAGEIFDVGVLKLDSYSDDKCCPVELCSAQGEDAFVVGHAVFGKEHHLQAMVTRGVVSRITSVNHVPVLIQSSCAVHSGASGGALLSGTGKLLGMVTCNAKDTISGASFPHINLVVPMTTIWPIIQSYIQSKDQGILQALHVENKQLEKLWMLQDAAARTSHKSML